MSSGLGEAVGIAIDGVFGALNRLAILIIVAGVGGLALGGGIVWYLCR